MASSSSSSEEEVKRKNKKSKHRKHKSKDKKHRKSRKHRRQSSSSSSSDSGEDQWLTKEELQTRNCQTKGTSEIMTSKIVGKIDATGTTIMEMDTEWDDFHSHIPTYSKKKTINPKSERRKGEEELSCIDKPGQNVRELNPYWKDGGHGLPDQHQPSTSSSSAVAPSTFGDGGLSWLKKQFLRAKEQAAEEGRSLEDIAEERWGSLANFFNMLEAAEAKAKQSASRDESGDHHASHRRSDDSNRSRFKRPKDDSDENNSDDDRRRQKRRHDHDHDRDRRRDRDRDHERDRKRDSREWSSSSHRRSKESAPSWRKEGIIVSSERSVRRKSKSRSPSRGGLQKPLEVPKMHVEVHERSNSPIEHDEVETAPAPPKVLLSDQEMNALNAKIMKAEMFGNSDQVTALKLELSQAQKDRDEFQNSGSNEKTNNTKVVTKVIMGNEKGRRRKDKITETHTSGQRTRYFPDDDKHSLDKMFQREKTSTAEDENAMFARLAGKAIKPNSDYDVDDAFIDRASSSKQSEKDKEREVRKVIHEEKQYNRTLETCQWCYDGKNLQRNLVIATGEKSFLCVPPYQSLTEGHCLIVPMFHASASTDLDEDVWSEMQRFRQAIVKMFRENDEDVVIFETAVFLKRHPHMYLECVPMPKEIGDLAPVYFKKAIQECETEWSQNKKLIDLRNRDVRRMVPKGLPYFSVDFGDDAGFAHVIEDEVNFPRNFAQEIIGGMLELDHHLWRKQKQDDFLKQRNKVMAFLKSWAPHDWTTQSSKE